VLSAANTTRSVIAVPRVTGPRAYTAVIKFIKTLDQDSTVMFNEAASFYKTAGFWDALVEKKNKLEDGGSLTPDQISDMMNILDDFQSLAKRSYHDAKIEWERYGTGAGLAPGDVTGAADAARSKPTQFLWYQGTKADGTKTKPMKVPAEGRAKFLQEMKDAKIKVQPMGTTSNAD
jgi:hypothetical protein